MYAGWKAATHGLALAWPGPGHGIWRTKSIWTVQALAVGVESDARATGLEDFFEAPLF